MSDNPFIKGFFAIEEARAKKTNIFDESKKLTAAQKKHLDKNDNDKIDAEDFKMLRKEEFEQIDEATGLYDRVGGIVRDFNSTQKDRDNHISHNAPGFKPLIRGDGSKYRDPGQIVNHSGRQLTPDHPFHDWLRNHPKTKDIGTVKDWYGSSKPREASNHGGVMLTTGENGNVEYGSPTRLRNTNVWSKTNEEVEFSEEEINFINSVMEAMPVAPTSENDSPNPTPKKKAEGSRAKGSMAD
jgi:hypothetical protein